MHIIYYYDNMTMPQEFFLEWRYFPEPAMLGRSVGAFRRLERLFPNRKANRAPTNMDNIYIYIYIYIYI